MANSRSGDSMLDRVVRILSSFDVATHALTVMELAARAGLPRASAYRLVDELATHGILAKEPDGKVRLGLHLWELANRSNAALDLKRVAMPFMEDVHAVVRQDTQLAVLHQDEVLILERFSRPGSAINKAAVAGRMQVHATSMGMVLLAFAPPHVSEGYLSRHRDAVVAWHPHFRGELAEIRRNGFAAFDGLIDDETTGAAVPVLDRHNTAVAALSVVLPRNSDVLRPTVMALRTAARGISRSLGEGSSEAAG
ncbi:MAG: IclR family transcriptional regulator [Acidobacteria bacterium]|nr:IclR family transcriptional regulator [Acidobacteriota bacterium]